MADHTRLHVLLNRLLDVQNLTQILIADIREGVQAIDARLPPSAHMFAPCFASLKVPRAFPRT